MGFHPPVPLVTINTPHRTKQKTKPLLREGVIQLQTPDTSEGDHQTHAVALQRAAPCLLQIYGTLSVRCLRSLRFQIEPMFQNTCPRIPEVFRTTGKLTAAPTARQRSPPSTSPSGFPPSTCQTAVSPTFWSRPRSDFRGFEPADMFSRYVKLLGERYRGRNGQSSVWGVGRSCG